MRKPKAKLKKKEPRKVNLFDFEYAAPMEPTEANFFWCMVPRLSFEKLQVFADQWKLPLTFTWGDIYDLERRVREMEAEKNIELKDWRLTIQFRAEFTKAGIKVYGPSWV